MRKRRNYTSTKQAIIDEAQLDRKYRRLYLLILFTYLHELLFFCWLMLDTLSDAVVGAQVWLSGIALSSL